MFGGSPPFSYSWAFGDGQTNVTSQRSTSHTYTQVGNYTVSLTVTDSTSSQTVTKNLAVHSWPARWAGWTLRWNITDNDGVDVWNSYYNSNLVIRDARMAGIVVRYKDGFCLFYDEFAIEYTDTGIFEYSPPGTPDPWMEIRTMSVNRFFSLVGGYWYQQVWRFYASGRWDAEVQIDNGGGCGADHYYEPHWRFDLALGGDSHEFMSQYTPAGSWRDLVWEGNYTDNEFRDASHNGTQWRIGGNWSYYYVAPFTSHTAGDLPTISSKMYLVRSKPNEVETTPTLLYDLENPRVWVNSGELAFDRNLAFWLLGGVWVHAPVVHVDGDTPNIVSTSFYPSKP